MRILCVSGYAAWDKVSQGKMPSHHLFGIHEMVSHYENKANGLRGILKDDVFGESGYVDFFLWKSGKSNVFSQVKMLLRMSKEYDLIYDQLNRCSIYLGMFKKLGMLKCKLLTIMHHPPYNLQLKIFDSDGYVFFNDDYKALAEKACPRKKDQYYVNEWMPDTQWSDGIPNDGNFQTDAFFIDNGKSRRDRECLIKAAETAKIRVDYAGTVNENGGGYAKAYCVDLKDDIGMIKRLRKYHAIIVPVLRNDKNKIGPLGITSFLDCIALGLPIVASDNVCFANVIMENNLGLVYKTGDSQSLSTEMKKIMDVKNYNDFRKSIIKFKQEKTMRKYAENLNRIIENLNNRR